MVNQEHHINETKKTIEHLTKTIFDGVLSAEVESIEELMQRRTLAIAKLISLHGNTEDTASLRAYLCKIRDIDSNIIQAILVKRDVLKMAIHNVEKLKNSLSV